MGTAEVSRTQKIKNKIKRSGSMVLMFLLGSLVIHCSKENNGKNQQNIAPLPVDLIKPVLTRQIEAGASEEYGSFDHYTKKDLEALVEVEKVILAQNDYIPISHDDFIERIENIFGRKIENTSSPYLQLSSNNQCDTTLTYRPFTSEHQDIYISKKHQLITYFYALPAFLDYTSTFPELKNLENTPLELIVNGKKIHGQRWKDISNLTELQNQNRMTTVHRNKYLFNDNRNSLNWLVDNDKDFLKRLVAEFGYDKEEKINNLVLRLFFEEYTKADDMSMGKLARLVFAKGCDGKLQIRKGLLNAIEKSTTEDDDKYITALGDYIISYLYKAGDNTFTPNEKAEIVAYITNIEGPAYHRYKDESDTAWKQTATPLFFLQSPSGMNRPEVLEIIKKNNYFDLQPLKEYIESGQLASEDPALHHKIKKNN